MKNIVACTATENWHTPYPVYAIEKIARTCYKSERKCTCSPDYPCEPCLTIADKFVKSLIERGHEAMIEHASVSFHFVCDRGVTHELVRHRLAAYAQESTRYCNYSKDKFGREITVLRPEGFTDQQWARREAALEQIEQLYFLEIDDGIKPQVARGVLPICLKTEIDVTANFREWRHIMKMRTSKAAHPQIRQMIGLAKEWFQKHYPVILTNLEDAQ